MRSGATLATSTGQVPRLLSCFRKPAQRNQRADQPAIDRGETEGDQAEPEEVLRRKLLAEEQAAQQDRDRRNQQCHQQRVGRAGAVDQAEIQHVAEGGAEQCKRRDRRDRAERRKGASPRLINDEREGQHHHGAGGQLAGRDAERRDAKATKAARPDGRQRIAERRGDAGKLREAVSAEVGEERGADHRRDAAEAEQYAGDLARAHALVGGEEVRDEDAPDRGRRIEDRSETAGDMGLAPAEQRERQGIVEQGQQHDRPPHLPRQPQRLAAKLEIGPHGGSRDAEAHEDIGQRWYVPDSNANKEKGPAPDEGKNTENQPVAAVHQGAYHRCGIIAGTVRRFRELAIKRVGIDRFHGRWEVWKSPPQRQQMHGRGVISPAYQSLSSSLMLVFDRVRSSTRLTITAQARLGAPSLPGSAPGTTTE